MAQRILVIDDQADIRELLEIVLTTRSFDVRTADGGNRGLEMLEEGEQPDLVLLDVQMPEIDGWETLTEIRKRYGEHGPRVVMCTVKGHPRDLIHGWTIGCDGYVWKPFDLQLLVSEVKAVLERSSDDRAKVRREAIGEARHLLRSLR